MNAAVNIARQRGFSLVEVLAAVVLLSLLLVPAVRALQGALQVETINRDALQDDFRLNSLAEFLLGEPFDLLADAAGGVATPSRFSDAAGSPGRRLVYISAYDADNADADDDDATGADVGMLKLRLVQEGSPRQLLLLRSSQ